MKVLVLDIETAPLLADVWQLFKANVGINQIRKNGYIMCWAAKWLHDDSVYYASCRERGEKDEKSVLKELVKLIRKADVVVGHNGDNFDMKWIRTRMLYHGMKPLPPVKQVDTYKVAKKFFRLHSNKLAFLADYLKCSPKKQHLKFPGHELWTECTLGNPEAWDEMEEYNVQDVESLEEVYLKLIPWDKGINFNLSGDLEEMRCPKCGGLHLQKRGYAYTNVSKFQRYRCNECGGWSRGRTNLLTKEARKNILTNIS
jgi:hypothetical protein